MLKDRMIAWGAVKSELAKKQNEYFTKVGDLESAMYWKGLWVAYQSFLLEVDKGNEGFRPWKPQIKK